MKFFVSSTDTNAGKTFFCAMLYRFFAMQKTPCLALKPVCCGGNDDLIRLKSAACENISHHEINFCSFVAPATPSVAAAYEKTTLDIAGLLAWCRKKMDFSGWVFFEGVGGWLVPLNGQYCVADWVSDLSLPVLLVVPDRIGCLNHTLLTVADMKRRKVPLAGIILNELSETDHPEFLNNEKVLAEDFGLPVLGRIPSGANELPEEIGNAILQMTNQTNHPIGKIR